MMQKDQIYTPRSKVVWGWQAWTEMLSELRSSKELIWVLFLRDFKARYRQTVLGFVWALITPFIIVGAFVFLNRSGILNIEATPVPYPAFALLGLTMWHVFAKGLAESSNALVVGKGMIAKINFPKEALVFSSLGQVFVDVVARFCLTLLVFALYRVVPSWSIILFPIAVLPLVFFTLALGFFLALFNALIRDVGNIISLATTFLLFTTPVLYPEPPAGIFSAVARFNPLATLISAPRDLLIHGHIDRPGMFFAVSALSLVLFLVGWQVFHAAETLIAERVGIR